MKTFSTILCAAAITVAGCGAAAADAWLVTEGPGGNITGTWKVTVANGVVSGDANMTTADRKTLTYGLTGKVDGNSWVINRTKPSDGNACTYTGNSPMTSGFKKPTEITGSAMCQQKTGVWKVKVVAAK